MSKSQDSGASEFKTDLLYILGVSKLIDSMYGKNDSNTYHYLKKLRAIIDKFNEKYIGIHAAVAKTSMMIYIKFFIKGESTDEVFSELITNDDEYMHENLSATPEIATSPESDNVYKEVTFDSLAVRRSPHRNMVEILYRKDSLFNENSPEFRILLKYVMDKGINKSIDVKVENDDIFCFDFNPEDYDGSGMVYSPKKFGDEPIY